MKARITINIVSAMLSSVASVLYVIFALGLIAREIGSKDLGIVSSSTGFLLPLGLGHSGIAGVTLKEIINLRRDEKKISKSQKISDVFLFCTILSVFIFLILIINAVLNQQYYIIPAAILVTTGFFCAVSQSVYVAEGVSWINSFFQIISLTICSLLLFSVLYFDFDRIDVFLLVIIAPPSVASILAFLFQLRRSEFRLMVFNSRLGSAIRAWRDVLPFFTISGLYTLFIAAPTLNMPETWVPELSVDEAMFWRLGHILSNLAVTFGAAFLPHLILVARNTQSNGDEHKVRAFLIIIALTTVILGSLITFAFSPGVIYVWLGLNVDASPYRFGWSMIVAIWCLASFLGSAAMMSASTNKVTACMAVGTATLLLVTSIIYPSQSLTLTWGYSVAMTTYLLCLLFVVDGEFRKSPSDSVPVSNQHNKFIK
jgi:O-antigen/teichoic acid export membrane protein